MDKRIIYIIPKDLKGKIEVNNDSCVIMVVDEDGVACEDDAIRIARRMRPDEIIVYQKRIYK